ncbi:hypothetical protein TPA0910_09310 [Streptomyces hygroscopicus subsp. sporocinereus]|uniref:Uncharacterized protein n=1 Tax=Streptomyces hygroscopicus TaxID=1912 RepID=A0ABQ3TU23_STRHY|nr:hypothetical protein TPA0910_09310 [Streptomyces hygroscopicus]
MRKGTGGRVRAGDTGPDDTGPDDTGRRPGAPKAMLGGHRVSTAFRIPGFSPGATPRRRPLERDGGEPESAPAAGPVRPRALGTVRTALLPHAAATWPRRAVRRRTARNRR